jgi:hypothetical protein
MKERIKELRNEFLALSFFTETEIKNLLIAIYNVSLDTETKPQEILFRFNQAWQTKIGNC